MFLSELLQVWHFIDHYSLDKSLNFAFLTLLQFLLLKHQLANALWNSIFCGEEKNKAAGSRKSSRTNSASIIYGWRGKKKKQNRKDSKIHMTKWKAFQRQPSSKYNINTKKASWFFLECPSLNLSTQEWQCWQHILTLTPLQVTTLWNQSQESFLH